MNNAWLRRWYQATKSNNPTMAARIDSLKDEMDEALNKVEMCKVGSVSSQKSKQSKIITTPARLCSFGSDQL